MTNKALIVVDYSYDFIADDGRLTCGKPGQDIEQFIVERLNQYQHQHDNIFFMMDLHFEEDPYHPETKLFPPHNIAFSNSSLRFKTSSISTVLT